MRIESAQFIRGVLGTSDILGEGRPQVVLVGRSNVGKSSIINALTGQKDLARTSSTPGRTQEINIFLINNAVYLIDLPGYGYAKTSLKERERIQKMIYYYLMESQYELRKVLLIIDAKVGPTGFDLEVLRDLRISKNVVVVANKIDKIKKSEYRQQLQNIQDQVGGKVLVCSAKMKIGMTELINEILS